VTERPALRAHLDSPAFVDAVLFTARKTGFDPRLVEKDYFCSLVLEQLDGIERLVFKGGTCLAKVHTGFCRLSEDLDFTIATDAGTSRGQRRFDIEEAKAAFRELQDRQPALRVAAPLTGASLSTQYVGTVAYASRLAPVDETIKVEIALREPLLVEPINAGAATLLLDPFDEHPLAPAILTTAMALLEALAEKFRAALSRREPAIRDFFDLDWAVRSGLVDPADAALPSLVQSKLAVPGNAQADVSAERLVAVRRQLDADLRPVLRPADFAAFDLDRTFALVSDMAARLGDAR
jgi:predicted nucleotidyltransferase component of viral defense system